MVSFHQCLPASLFTARSVVNEGLRFWHQEPHTGNPGREPKAKLLISNKKSDATSTAFLLKNYQFSFIKNYLGEIYWLLLVCNLVNWKFISSSRYIIQLDTPPVEVN